MFLIMKKRKSKAKIVQIIGIMLIANLIPLIITDRAGLLGTEGDLVKVKEIDLIKILEEAKIIITSKERITMRNLVVIITKAIKVKIGGEVAEVAMATIQVEAVLIEEEEDITIDQTTNIDY